MFKYLIPSERIMLEEESFWQYKAIRYLPNINTIGMAIIR